jgi:hypothetical protein
MTTTLDRPTPLAESIGVPSHHVPLVRRLVGELFLVTTGVHVGIVMTDAGSYRDFADSAVPGVRSAWADVFMAHPAFWGLAVAAGELTIAVLILLGGRWARLGLLGAIGFHVALLLFGWGFLLWCVPALALLVALYRREVRP